MMSSGRLRVLCLMMADALTIALVWSIAVVGYKAIGIGEYAISDYFPLWPVIPLFIIINAFSKTYHGNWLYPAMPLSPSEEFRRLFLSALLTHLGLAAIIGFSRSHDYSRFLIIAVGFITACGAQIVRDIFRGVLKKRGIAQIPVMLVGDGAIADDVAESLKGSAYIGFDAVRCSGSVREVVEEASAKNITILLSCLDPRVFAVQMEEFVKWFHHIEYLPTAAAFPVAEGRAISIDGIGGLEMVNQVHMKALHWEKSVLDRALAFMIFICAIPAFVIVPMLIKVTSKGPVFYRAHRLGKKGRPIRVWKFRSMFADADKRLDALLASDPALAEEFKKDFKLKNDPRVTPLGKILRKTSIDELPQLFNVFAGDMALVGPRPIVEKEIEYYGKDFEIFSSVKPGITGLWQASGRSDTDYAKRVALDVHYVLNWSPWLDLWIVFRTAAAVLKMKGSY